MKNRALKIYVAAVIVSISIITVLSILEQTGVLSLAQK